ncbi:ABC1-domain-containing protein [Vararia minispora EC-137]|uniref:ABC1-domain-containing protein n=1 Tax=Vararia minispora EC-137 TaxID=1314806 RepID=A0ACB8QR88_9AGAM|nr:ABC1-domain-containing protein [Vararia minispora EC-137]
MSKLLPREIRSLVLHHRPIAPLRLHARSASLWSRPAFFTRTPAYPRIVLSPSLAFWVLPVAGGLALYFIPRPEPVLPPNVLESPTLIPCSLEPTAPTAETFILSPSEHDLTLGGRILSIFRNSIWEPLLTARRFIRLCFLFLPVIITSPMLLVGHHDHRLDGERWGAIWWYGFLVYQMENAGPTFIKLAQWAATRADIFSTHLCDRFRKMHSNGKPHSFQHTKSVIERVFQRPFEEIFEEFDQVPIGTGAIAQVYRATLKQDLLPPSYFDPKRSVKSGPHSITPSIAPEPSPAVPTATVAIKVLHPRVRKMIARDLSIMSFFAHVITLIPGMQWISLPEEVVVFGSMMHEQLNLHKEAENLITFEHNFISRKEPIFFPRPLQVWSTQDLLIEEYQHALPLNAFLKNGAGPFSDQLAELGLDAFLKMLLLDNFVHSDLHPGNIFVKFSRPSTSDLLCDLWRSLFDANYAPAQPDSAATTEVVNRLQALTHDKKQWTTELQSLNAQGYLPELIFIDAGLVTTLSARNRTNFLDLFRAVAEFDGYRTGQLMVARSRSPELAVDPETFALKMQHIVLTVKRKTFSLGQIKISDILTDVLKAVRQHHVKMEGDFINTVISILLLEGIGRQLDPGLDLFKSALPILRQLGREMATQENIKRLPDEDSLSFLKLWVWLEARELASAALINADDMIRYDLLSPNI